MIEKVINRLRIYLRNVALFARQSVSGSGPELRLGEIHFDVADPRFERYFFCLVKFFEIAGYGISLRFRPGLLLNLRNYADLLYNIKGLRIVFSPPRSAIVTITDRKDIGEAGKVLCIDPDYLNTQRSTSGFVFPYSMHPLVYDKRIDAKVLELRGQQRPLRVFSYFANLESYENNEIRELFGKMNRREVGETVLGMIGQLPMKVICKPEDLKGISTGEAGFAVIDNVRIRFEDWLPTLAKADFFIAAPGVLMPYCHNLIEAMAVGTIPITEYPEMWSPPLTDGVNCLAYSSPEELEEKIREALDMEAARVTEIRRGVLEYYDTWFDPKAAVTRLMERLDNIDRIYLLAGHLTVSEFKAALSHTV